MVRSLIGTIHLIPGAENREEPVGALPASLLRVRGANRQATPRGFLAETGATINADCGGRYHLMPNRGSGGVTGRLQYSSLRSAFSVQQN
jgi:hypothetical protein